MNLNSNSWKDRTEIELKEYLNNNHVLKEKCILIQKYVDDYLLEELNDIEFDIPQVSFNIKKTIEELDWLNENDLKQNSLDVFIYIDVIIKEPEKIKDIEAFKKHIQDNYSPYKEKYKFESRNTHWGVIKPKTPFLEPMYTIGSKIATYLTSKWRNNSNTLNIRTQLNFVESENSPSSQVKKSAQEISGIL